MSELQTPRDILLKVYDAAIAEYRFNVQLSWDRNKFFLTLISAIIASGVGFIKVASESRIASAFLLCLFAVSVAITLYAIEALSTGKKYIRESNYKKMLIERELGLLDTIPHFKTQRSNLSISVTSGQRNFGLMMLSEDVKKEISRKSIADNLAKIYAGMIAVEMVGCIISVGMTVGPVNIKKIEVKAMKAATSISESLTSHDWAKSMPDINVLP